MKPSLPRSAMLLAGVGLVSACAGEPITSPLQEDEASAPLFSAAASPAVAGQYIIVLKEGASDVRGLAQALVRQNGGQLGYTYEYALQGFSAKLSPQAVAALRSNNAVAYIEEDQIARATTTQTGATWGIDRVDQRDLPLSTTYEYTSTGAGVNAYIVDTGLRFTHDEFGGRATSGYDAIDGGTADDCNGHGTHVAGTVGGTLYGVAKSANLIAVRVLNCSGSGTYAQVIAGVDWVTANHVKPAVANMSLGGPTSTALDQAVRNSITAGVTYSIAAGNDYGSDACLGSPSRVTEALVVGSTTSTDARSSFSNIGTCLDLFAPGSSITSAWWTSNTATNTISGTSMAAPHVAGVAALYLQGDPAATPTTVMNAIINGATTGKVTDAGTGSPNRLVYSQLGASPPPSDAPCTDCRYASGTFTAQGQTALVPPNGYTTTTTGTHTAWLRGPPGTDFDLQLGMWNGTKYVLVAEGTGSTYDEIVTYEGAPGKYIWRLVAKSGTGEYEIWVAKPN